MRGVVALTLLALLAPAAAKAQSGIEYAQGFAAGKIAGEKVRVYMPFLTSVGTIGVMAALDNEPVTNNRVVSAVVTQAFVGAGVSYVLGIVLRPRPSKEDRAALVGESPQYIAAFNQGFREEVGGKRLVATALGVISGAVISGAVYAARIEDDPTPRRAVVPMPLYSPFPAR